MLPEPTIDDLVDEVENVAGVLIERFHWTERRLLQAVRVKRVTRASTGTGLRMSGEDDYREELQESARDAKNVRRVNNAIRRAVRAA